MNEPAIVHPLAEEYAIRYTSPEGEVLKLVNEETLSSHAHAHMLSGHVQGKVLQFISEVLKPKTILEIGTFTGYSALCLVEGLQKGGILHTIELRPDDAETAR